MCSCGGRNQAYGSGTGPSWEFTPTSGPKQMYWSEEEAKRAQAAYGGSYQYVGMGGRR